MYDEIRKQVDQLLTGPLFEAFKAVDCVTPQYDASTLSPHEAFRAKVRIGHLPGTPEARYLVQGLGSRLELYVQLNVYRLVVVYRIPAQGTWDSGALQPRFARWAIGATEAGWTIGWRDVIDADDEKGRAIEVYCYASLPIDFLKNENHQLYWITDVVQMTRSFLIEARRAGVELPNKG